MSRKQSPAVYDSVLPFNQATDIRDLLESNLFPWYFNPTINGTDYPHNPDAPTFQFTHNLYRDNEVKSEHFQMFVPLLTFLNVKNLVRMKLNLNPQHHEPVQYGLHDDSLEPHRMSAIYYPVPCDGPTVFEDGTEIEPRVNRLIKFPSRLLHTGTAPVTSQRRIILNIIYE